jgi:hypothetical protein
MIRYPLESKKYSRNKSAAISAALCYSLPVYGYFMWTTTFPPWSNDAGTLLYSTPFLSYTVSENVS